MAQADDGDAMLAKLAALANPHRMRIVAALYAGTNYVSQIARELGISRPLLHMHLQKLEAAGLVTSESSVAQDGKARRYFAVSDFSITLDAATISHASITLSAPADNATKAPGKDGKLWLRTGPGSYSEPWC